MMLYELTITCAVSFLSIQGKTIVTSALEATNGVSAFTIFAKTWNHFTFIDVYKASRDKNTLLSLE